MLKNIKLYFKQFIQCRI